MQHDRVTAAGKFFRCNGNKWYVKGFSYGPFTPNSDSEPLPEAERLREDFAHMQRLGANCIRVYYPPPESMLDEALEHDLRVFVDVPWQKHRCFFEDWQAQEDAQRRIEHTAKSLGNHPAVFAISVVNEIPVDVVRFYGHRRVRRYVQTLLDLVKQNAPECLATFASFPTTEFLTADGADFMCFNVYLHDEHKLGGYLDRLQHSAGNKPLVLGEYGIDTIREGEIEQAEMLSRHLNQVYGRGLAGSFVFAYTDDWFTGGHQIDDWAFGVTDRSRNEKPSTLALPRIWNHVPNVVCSGLPKASVVVCSYNGSATLHDCLDSLMRLDYADFEVILVDDGSTDNTREVADRFPQILYHRQRNKGLSFARNVGADLATGEIVAYTDSDCVVDEHWLRYLVQAMQDQNVEAIGGPNITPDSDGWVAKCVAASPGNPSHVMLDDQHAEHIPGCNMAFRRSTLLGLGGFDRQYRQAGDDVDICWRMLDANLSIGYASGAMVWHRRRATVQAYANQQKGYGRSESMVHFKHPQRCGAMGRSSWHGIIYGEGAIGLPLMPETIYHGRFGQGLFQTIYRHNHYGVWAILMSLEWHLAALFGLLLTVLFWPFALVSGLMWAGTLAVAVHSAWRASLPIGAPRWCRPLVGYLYVMQPIWRGWHRMTHLLRTRRRLPSPDGNTEILITDDEDDGCHCEIERNDDSAASASLASRAATRETEVGVTRTEPQNGDGSPLETRPCRCKLIELLEQTESPETKRISASGWDLYWQNDQFRGREELLPVLVDLAKAARWRGDFENAWAEWDVKLVGDCWHDILIHTATEELGWPNRFTRARCVVRPTRFNRVSAVNAVIWATVALLSGNLVGLLIGLGVCGWVQYRNVRSRRQCLRAVTRLVAVAAKLARLDRVGAADPVSLPEQPASVPEEQTGPNLAACLAPDKDSI